MHKQCLSESNVFIRGLFCIWVSEWVIIIIIIMSSWSMFQLYHGENKLHFDEMMVMSVLYQTSTLTVRVDTRIHNYDSE